ncbi:hypothetical protein LC048_23690 [Mesobacillus subterraneus]|nr:hypothetical protein [Mesobacillus subterraneus]WLR55244.1 hypothetical protein LC048_23690 [Mesobacillus subterraneus]
MLGKLNVRFLEDADLQLYFEGSLDRVFFNMNHPVEYEDAKKWAESGE